MLPFEPVSPAKSYILYDRRTGQIVHRHDRYVVEPEAQVEVDPEVERQEILSLVAEANSDLRALATAESANYEILVLQGQPDEGLITTRDMMVDVTTGALAPMPHIVLAPQKVELFGDGKDSTKIEIRLVGHEGEVVDSFNGTIKVSTSRGKLSTQGGLVKMKRGIGEIKLTSANETADEVQVYARCVDSQCVGGHTVLEFL